MGSGSAVGVADRLAETVTEGDLDYFAVGVSDPACIDKLGVAERSTNAYSDESQVIKDRSSSDAPV
jgi:hypothetical protein